MPPTASQGDWELSVIMPLGVIANQLVKIEGDLRFLSMKAAENSGEEGARSTKSLDARLELIYDVLESIHSLLGKLQADIHPKLPATPSTKPGPTGSSSYKPAPELDD